MVADLLTAVRARVTAFREYGDAAAVLSRAAAEQAEELVRAAGPATLPVEVAAVAGWLYWCRFEADPDGGLPALRRATDLFVPVGQADPLLLPAPLREPLIEEYERQARALLEPAVTSGDVTGLPYATGLLYRIVQATAPEDPRRAAALSDLSVAAQLRYADNSDLTELDEAVAFGRAAVATLARADFLTNLSSARLSQYRAYGDVAALTEAVSLAEAATRARPTSATIHRALVRAVRACFDRTGLLADLDRIVNAARAGMAEADPVPELRLALAHALWERYRRAEALADLDEVVATCRGALGGTPAPDERVTWLSMLGQALGVRYGRTWERRNLDEAVTVSRQAAREADPGARVPHLLHLASVLDERLRIAWSADDETEQVLSLRAATEAGPEHKDHARALQHLGGALVGRFQRRGRKADLDEAISHTRAAVATSGADAATRRKALSNLAVSLEIRRGPGDLDEAVTTARAAVAVPGDSGSGTELANLGKVLTARFLLLGDLVDLEEAISVTRSAVRVSTDPVGRARCLNNLCGMLTRRFTTTRRIVDLDEAIDAGRASVAAAPPRWPERTRYLTTLDLALRLRSAVRDG
ncbi:hypothetical protein GCM10010112_48580 [Actinoplanes lobatus]|uniref:Tetratricopeptide repeat protein n=1 Tax=Actinoplanes lobatus TaxID=113568 RepID=A0ABQ4AIV3_9ACTN|nr:hypothetical protein GCM10010112_48580 [Actinoplanes lobatus]GIE40926.1 hypothetical protein Alo02nite_38240 [Actinoplanes lobatus]